MLIRTQINQSAIDLRRVVELDTGITLDGKSGWNIKAARAHWFNAQSCPINSDFVLTVGLSTTPAPTTFDSSDQILAVDWANINQALSAGSTLIERYKSVVLFEPRITVQPKLFLFCESSVTGLANQTYLELWVEPVKLTDLEVMRLYAGGA